ncbi:MAG: S41 family peptidase, partial [Pseudomonadota bacterium]
MTAPSVKPKDNFHFSESTEDFLESRNSVASASYGVSFIGFRSSPPRDFRVRYTDPGTPAAALEGGKPKFVRGARILEIDGIDFVNDGSSAGLDILNAGLFPATAGETHNFTLREPDGTIRTITVVSEDLSPAAVNQVRTIDTATGRVGYILFNTFSPFSSEAEIIDAIRSLDTQGVTDLVIDLRYNGGGLLAVSSQLGYMVAGPTRTSGRTFELLQFNADAGNINPVTGQTNDPIPFYSTALGFSATNGTPLPDLGLTRVFILSTGGTCSASEALINGLRGIGIEVILIGDRTCGKPFGFYPTDNCGTTYYTIQFQGVNDVGFGDYAEGFSPANANAPFAVDLPGCQVSDDLSNPLGDPGEALLAAALQYRDNQTCPIPPASLPPLSASSASAAQADEGLEVRMPTESLAATNRDMRLPGGVQ